MTTASASDGEDFVHDGTHVETPVTVAEEASGFAFDGADEESLFGLGVHEERGEVLFDEFASPV
jgi:hypothetical protein